MLVDLLTVFGGRSHPVKCAFIQCLRQRRPAGGAEVVDRADNRRPIRVQVRHAELHGPAFPVVETHDADIHIIDRLQYFLRDLFHDGGAGQADRQRRSLPVQVVAVIKRVAQVSGSAAPGKLHVRVVCVRIRLIRSAEGPKEGGPAVAVDAGVCLTFNGLCVVARGEILPPCWAACRAILAAISPLHHGVAEAADSQHLLRCEITIKGGLVNPLNIAAGTVANRQYIDVGPVNRIVITVSAIHNRTVIRLVCDFRGRHRARRIQNEHDVRYRI